MPGPRNIKKKKKTESATHKRKQQLPTQSSPASKIVPSATKRNSTSTLASQSASSSNSCPSSPPIDTPPPFNHVHDENDVVDLIQLLNEQCIQAVEGKEVDEGELSKDEFLFDGEPANEDQTIKINLDYVEPIVPLPTTRYVRDILPQEPYIHDPGNGPRVRNTRAFLVSYFAQASSSSSQDLLAAEFGSEEVLHMLLNVLPEEIALILWYNKSRPTSRICPTCRRLYCLGDRLPILFGSERPTGNEEDPPDEMQETSEELENEQRLSGLCSPICFIFALYNCPSAIKRTWGRTCNEMDDEVWELLNTPSPASETLSGDEGTGQGQGDPDLTMLVRMTRLVDLGLGQLFFPGEEFDVESVHHRPVEGREEERQADAGKPLLDQCGVD